MSEVADLIITKDIHSLSGLKLSIGYANSTICLSIDPDATIDRILQYTCDLFQCDYDTHTFVAPFSATALALDQTYGWYHKEHNLDRINLEVGTKWYVTMAIQEGDKDVAVLKLKGSKYIVMAATEDKLIQKTVDTAEEQDMQFVDELLLTFRNFAEPSGFFGRLIDQFNAMMPPNPTPADIEYYENNKDTVQRRSPFLCLLHSRHTNAYYRVTEVIHLWATRFWHDFDQSVDLMDDLKDFVEQLIENGGHYQRAAISLNAVIAQQTQNSLEIASRRISVERATPTTVSQFDDFPVRTIATQLCLYNFALFKSIHPIEFLNKVWGKAGIAKMSSSPNLDFFSTRFEVECYWIATEVLSTKDLKKRIKKLAKCIELAGVSASILTNFAKLITTYAALH